MTSGLTCSFPIDDPEGDDLVSVLDERLHQPVERLRPRLIRRHSNEEQPGITSMHVVGRFGCHGSSAGATTEGSQHSGQRMSSVVGVGPLSCAGQDSIASRLPVGRTLEGEGEECVL
jgi:hypothetical protein